MNPRNHEKEVLLDEFFKNRETWSPNSYGYKIISVILLSLSIFILIMPYQIWEGDYISVIFLFYLELIGLETYLKPYCNFWEDNGKIVRVYDILKYLPISHRQLLGYRWKKLIKLCLRLTGITMFCQIAFSFAFLHTVSWGNILMPLLCSFVLPVSILIFLFYVEDVVGK